MKKILKYFFIILLFFTVLGATSIGAYAGNEYCSCYKKCTTCGGDHTLENNKNCTNSNCDNGYVNLGTCSTCNGNKTIPLTKDCTTCTNSSGNCKDCGGDGFSSSSFTSNSSGKLASGFSYGSYKTETSCVTCGGYGTKKTYYSGNTFYGNTETAGYYKAGSGNCKTCGGDGQMPNGQKNCDTCKGAGKIETKCTTCGGDGKEDTTCTNNTCNTNGYSYNKNCGICYGDGIIWTGDCKALVNCYKCNGTGYYNQLKCTICNGTKKLEPSEKTTCICVEGQNYTASIAKKCPTNQCYVSDRANESCQGHRFNSGEKVTIIPGTENTIEATCTTPAYKTWEVKVEKQCLKTGCLAWAIVEEVQQEEVGEPLGHDYPDSWTSNGATGHYRVCSRCGEKQEQSHTLGTTVNETDGTVTIDASCTGNGTTRYGSYTPCTANGCTYTKDDFTYNNTTPAAKGHDWDANWSYLDVNLHYKDCNNNAHDKLRDGSDRITEKHRWGNYSTEYEISRYEDPDNPSTCTGEGIWKVTYRTDKECLDCGFDYYDDVVKNETKPSLGHDMSVWKSNNDGTHTTKCSICNHTHIEDCTIVDWHNTGLGYEENGEAVIFLPYTPVC